MTLYLYIGRKVTINIFSKVEQEILELYYVKKQQNKISILGTFIFDKLKVQKRTIEILNYKYCLEMNLFYL